LNFAFFNRGIGNKTKHDHDLLSATWGTIYPHPGNWRDNSRRKAEIVAGSARGSCAGSFRNEAPVPIGLTIRRKPQRHHARQNDPQLLSRFRSCHFSMKSKASFRIPALSLVVLISGTRLLQADCSLTSTGNIPINDLGPGLYQGFMGGLYPGGGSNPPPEPIVPA